MIPEAVYPSRFEYVSTRLTSEIIAHSKAIEEGRWETTKITSSLEGSVPDIATAGREWERTQRPDTPQLLAVEATGVLSNQRRISDLEFLSDGDYFRVEFEVHVGIFNQALIWEPDPVTGVRKNQDVAVMYGSGFVAGVGRVFVALFGSPRNLQGEAAGEIKSRPKPVPSDAPGLYRILQAVVDHGERGVREQLLDHDDGRELSSIDRVQAALTTIQMIKSPYPLVMWEILAEAFWIARDVGLDFGNVHRVSPPPPLQASRFRGPDHYDLAIVGAAVWAGPPARRQHPRVEGDGDKIHRIHEEILEEAVFYAALRGPRKNTIPGLVLSADPVEWESVASWFVKAAEGRHIELSRLFKRRRRRHLNPRRYFGDAEECDSLSPVDAGFEGIVVQYESNGFALIASNGDIFPVEEGRDSHSVDMGFWVWADEELADEKFEVIKRVVWYAAIELRRRPIGSGQLMELPLYNYDSL